MELRKHLVNMLFICLRHHLPTFFNCGIFNGWTSKPSFVLIQICIINICGNCFFSRERNRKKTLKQFVISCSLSFIHATTNSHYTHNIIRFIICALHRARDVLLLSNNARTRAWACAVHFNASIYFG